jgi:hypothetical protein
MKQMRSLRSAILAAVGIMRTGKRGTRATWCRRAVWSPVVAGVMLAAGVVPAGAALTTPVCLAKKLKEWGNLRKCQATENGKVLQAKPADPGKCPVKFDAKLATLNAQATAAAIACRYVDNGDGTVTDYDTGLMWEQKTDDGSVHDKDNTYSWCLGAFPNCTNPSNPPDGTAFTAFLGTLNNGTSSDGTATGGCFAGHCDWRLPAVEELAGILDMGVPGCGPGGPCIDQTVFGPTDADRYWSASTLSNAPNEVYFVYFINGGVSDSTKSSAIYGRAVRSGL